MVTEVQAKDLLIDKLNVLPETEECQFCGDGDASMWEHICIEVGDDQALRFVVKSHSDCFQRFSRRCYAKVVYVKDSE